MGMKRVASIISVVFHPLIMPSLGLLLMLNSGSYVSMFDPAAKRAILFVLALGTLVFPLMMIPVFFYRNLVYSQKGHMTEERWVPRLIILILYIITCIYFMRLPLNRMIQGYVLSVTITLSLLVLLNIWLKISTHAAGPGGLVGLIIALIMMFEVPLEGFLLLAILAGGVVGSAKLISGEHRPFEVYAGFMIGFLGVLITLLVY
jgi:hypothetical protein